MKHKHPTMITQTSAFITEPKNLPDQISDIENKINSYLVNNYEKFTRLTLREKQILRLIADGCNSYEISDRLFISIHTVNNHRKNIMNKLETVSLPHLIKFAVWFGLVE